ncbi:MAG: hydantoinase B/oxoprolinase family protein [Gammaproteobacteria bacterium]
MSLFAARTASICDEMGAVLRHAAFSPNIKDRLDYSCAVFDRHGRMIAQAAHIPVHLGSMAHAMQGIVAATDWHPGDVLILNDPYLGGTHLPDVTLVAPVFAAGRICAFVAARAHHADIGCPTPGSMPLARRLDEEGVVIPPSLLVRAGVPDERWFAALLGHMRDPALSRGDFSAQAGAVSRGVERVAALAAATGSGGFDRAADALQDYGETLARSLFAGLPRGTYSYTDLLDGDGFDALDIPIRVQVRLDTDGAQVDFGGTAAQVPGNVNCPLSVTAAAVYYVFFCLMPPGTPLCAGSLRPVSIAAPAGTLVNARPPAAVAAGNVETSTRIVDALLGALWQAIPARIPAASHGSMNNLAMGGERWSYYETIGGGMGAHAAAAGQDAVQTHMTNTRNTPIEVLEADFPLRVVRYAIRRGSGGSGRHRGGDGIVREYEFRADATVTVLGERRRHGPWGTAGGSAGAPARTLLNGAALPAKIGFDVRAGDRLRIETAGGGGWGSADA